MTRYKKQIAGPHHWSKWIPPVMRGYRWACCDCGLVHNVDFRVIKVLKHVDTAKITAKIVTGYQVEFRAKRNNRATGQIRRHMKKTAV